MNHASSALRTLLLALPLALGCSGAPDDRAPNAARLTAEPEAPVAARHLSPYVTDVCAMFPDECATAAGRRRAAVMTGYLAIVNPVRLRQRGLLGATEVRPRVLAAAAQQFAALAVPAARADAAARELDRAASAFLHGMGVVETAAAVGHVYLSTIGDSRDGGVAQYASQQAGTVTETTTLGFEIDLGFIKVTVGKTITSVWTTGGGSTGGSSGDGGTGAGDSTDDNGGAEPSGADPGGDTGH